MEEPNRSEQNFSDAPSENYYSYPVIEKMFF